MTSIVVHYQEIALKGKNRPWFLGRLVRNLKRALSDLDVIAVRALMGRIEIQLGPGTSRETAGERVGRTFGIAFYFFGKERGPGGLPTGTAGRVTCLLSGGIDSPVAAHRMMKRGCAAGFVHFHSYP